jgi:DNA-binding transcriptional regulator GbsR (MarR family)
MTDVYEMFRVILAERKRREIDPTLGILRACLAETGRTKADATIRDRLSRLLDFFEVGSTWYEQMAKVPTGMFLKCARLGDKIFKLLKIPTK